MPYIRRSGCEAIAVVATMVALACSGDNGPVGSAGSIQLSVSPPTLPLQPGGSGSLTVTLTRSGGFSGLVTLATSGLPPGVTVTITPPQLSGTTVNATVNLTVAAVLAPETYPAMITATAQGVAQATASYQLTITDPPNYALSVTPTALTIPAGASGGATVNIARTSFTGAVALSLLNPPSGITGAFTPTPSTTNLSSLVVSVPANMVPGNYPLVIQGTATGPGLKTTTLAVTVTAPPTGGTAVEYQFCDASDAPAFFAYQDGTGAWQPVVGSTSGGLTRFAFTITQGRGGVLTVYRTASSTIGDALAAGRRAQVRQDPERSLRTRDRVRARFAAARHGTTALARSFADAYQTYVVYASAAELVQDGIDACGAVAQGTKTVKATVTGVTNGQYGILSLGLATELFIGSTTTNPITFADVPTGLADFVATRMTSAGTPPDKAFIFRNLNVPDGGSLPAIDFNATASVVPATATATITGGAGDALEIFTELVTRNGPLLMWFDLAPSVNASRAWAGFPQAAMTSDDFHTVVVFASPPASETDFRVALKYVGQVANTTLALGPVITAPAASVVTAGAYPRFRFQASVPPEYNKGVSINVLSTQSAGNAFGLIATSAWLTASGNPLAYDFTTPDVGGLAGFPAAARLTAGPNDVSVEVFGFTGPGIFDLQPNLGSELRGATKGTRITVP